MATVFEPEPCLQCGSARACKHATIDTPWDNSWLTPTERKTWNQG